MRCVAELSIVAADKAVSQFSHSNEADVIMAGTLESCLNEGLLVGYRRTATATVSFGA